MLHVRLVRLKVRSHIMQASPNASPMSPATGDLRSRFATLGPRYG